MSEKREFKLLNTYGKVSGTFTGQNPSQAAMKAASRGHDSIMLCEHYGNAKYSDKVHVYKGSIRQLSSSEKTPFALKHNISSRPQVVKMGTMHRPLSTRKSDNDYDPEIMKMEDKCSRIFPEEGQDCSSPCAIHPKSGNCYYPD